MENAQDMKNGDGQYEQEYRDEIGDFKLKIPLLLGSPLPNLLEATMNVLVPFIVGFSPSFGGGLGEEGDCTPVDG
jgi:hypothetical protein